MNKVKKFCGILALPIILCWFLMTIFVDIIAVPTVFRNVSNVHEAGKVGMTVFTSLNRMELIFAFIFIGAVIHFHKKLKSNFLLVLSLVLLFWSFSYNLYFTPKIIHYTQLIRSAVPGDPMMIEYQNGHHFFHTLYRYLDTTKLIMLLSVLVVLIKRKWAEEE